MFQLIVKLLTRLSPRISYFLSLSLFLLTSLSLYLYHNYTRLYKLPTYKLKAVTSAEQAVQLKIRILNFDGALLLQKDLINNWKPKILDLKKHGPKVRLDCTFQQFKNFEDELSRLVGSRIDKSEPGKPLITFYGSNDFHHVSLSLIRRVRTKINLVILDNHPDYIQYYPFGLHCGCWFHHASSLPTVHKAFHFGGYSGEFEDESVMRWSTPWQLIKSGKLTILPAQEAFKGPKWSKVTQYPLRPSQGKSFLTKQHLLDLLEPFRQDLESCPLYITLDKDVMQRYDALQNWNSGVLIREEVILILTTLIEMSGGKLWGMDITGDFSKVNVEGLYRGYLHQTQHSDEENLIDQKTATHFNQITNKKILKEVSKALGIVTENVGQEDFEI